MYQVFSDAIPLQFKGDELFVCGKSLPAQQILEFGRERELLTAKQYRAHNGAEVINLSLNCSRELSIRLHEHHAISVTETLGEGRYELYRCSEREWKLINVEAELRRREEIVALLKYFGILRPERILHFVPRLTAVSQLTVPAGSKFSRSDSSLLVFKFGKDFTSIPTIQQLEVTKAACVRSVLSHLASIAFGEEIGALFNVEGVWEQIQSHSGASEFVRSAIDLSSEDVETQAHFINGIFVREREKSKWLRASLSPSKLPQEGGATRLFGFFLHVRKIPLKLIAGDVLEKEQLEFVELLGRREEEQDHQKAAKWLIDACELAYVQSEDWWVLLSEVLNSYVAIERPYRQPGAFFSRLDHHYPTLGGAASQLAFEYGERLLLDWMKAISNVDQRLKLVELQAPSGPFVTERGVIYNTSGGEICGLERDYLELQLDLLRQLDPKLSDYQVLGWNGDGVRAHFSEESSGRIFLEKINDGEEYFFTVVLSNGKHYRVVQLGLKAKAGHSFGDPQIERDESFLFATPERLKLVDRELIWVAGEITLLRSVLY